MRRCSFVGMLMIGCVACGPSVRPPTAPVDEAPAAGPVIPPALVGPPVGATAPRPPGLRQRIEVLRELVRLSTGTERLDLQRRLYEDLLATEQAAERTEAQAMIEAMVASPDFAAWDSADAALFDLATSRQAAHRDADALAAWRRLLAEHPSSRFVPDAQLALAEAGYVLVLGFRDHRAVAYARYKLGWIHLNLGRREEAMADFLEVARTADGPLRRESIKDVVRVYAEIGAAASGYRFLERVAPGRGGELVLQLAERYADLGKLDAAVIAYGAALEVLDPEPACAAALGLVRAQILGGVADEVLEAIAQLVDRHPTGTCGRDAEAVVTELATVWTRESRRAGAEFVARTVRAWELAAQLAQTDRARQAALAAAQSLRRP